MKKYFSSYCHKHTTVWDPKEHPKYNSHNMYVRGIITDYLQDLGLSLNQLQNSSQTSYNHAECWNTYLNTYLPAL
jgi:hypothetical protein